MFLCNPVLERERVEYWFMVYQRGLFSTDWDLKILREISICQEEDLIGCDLMGCYHYSTEKHILKDGPRVSQSEGEALISVGCFEYLARTVDGTR